MLFTMGRFLRSAARWIIFITVIWALVAVGGQFWADGATKDLFTQGQLLLLGLGLLPLAYIVEYLGVIQSVKAQGQDHLLEHIQVPVISFIGYVFSFVWFALSVNTYWFTRWGIPGGDKSVWPLFDHSVSTLWGWGLVVVLLVAFGIKLQFWFEDSDDDDDDEDDD